MLRRFLLIAVITLVFTGSLYTSVGCSTTPTEPSMSATLGGMVRDAVTGAPITNKPNAIEVVQGHNNFSASISSSGTWSVSGLEGGTVTVRVTVSGYKDYTETFPISSATTVHDIALQPAQ